MTDPGARIQYEFEGFQLDIQQRLLLSGPERRPVPLPPKVFDTLLYMVERRGELLDKSTLLEAIWPHVVVEENSLNQNVSALRRVLGETPGEHRFIVTEPGRGYRFVAEVRVARGTAAAAAPTRTIAVLPFANLTGDAGKDYLGDGIAEELIHKLARIPGLRVPSRTSSFAYKGRCVDSRQIARDLDVSVVLEGSVRGAGERLRVTAQLIDGLNGYHLWSESYDRRFEDLFALQDDIAGAIVGALRVTLGDSQPPAPPTRNLEAYHLFLQGNALEASGGPNFERAFALYQRAVALDPRFARAYNQMAGVRAIAAVLGFKLPGSLADSEREVSEALRLDPTLGGAHAAVGAVQALQGKWLDAEDRFRRAFAADDADPAALQNHGMLVQATAGHLRRYHHTVLAAQRLAPAWLPVLINVTVASLLVGQDEEARATARLARELGVSMSLGPLPDAMATLALRAGDPRLAADIHCESLRPAARAHGGEAVVRQVFGALADPAARAAAIHALDELHERLSGADFFEIMNRRMLYWYAQLGALDSAYRLLGQSLDRFATQGMLGAAWSFLWMREMADFRRDARFQDVVVERLGLMPYWRQFGPPDGCEVRDGRLVCS
jgi:TolB-like protein